MTDLIRLIVGLGNPGDEYADTRHNAGFWLLDRYAEQAGARWSTEKAFQARIAKINVTGHAIWLCEPMTYMNRSGGSVASLAQFYKIAAAQICVVHDELDLLPGAAKLKFGGSAAGHNGLKDINARLGTQDYWRIRLGIGHPRVLALNQAVADFVLHRPSRDHQQAIDQAIDAAAAVLPLLVEGQFEAAMHRLHTAV